jgi:hypothetical protein
MTHRLSASFGADSINTQRNSSIRRAKSIAFAFSPFRLSPKRLAPHRIFASGIVIRSGYPG